MGHGSFVHLGVKTALSLLEGAIHIKDLARRVAELKMPAVGMSDSNNLFAALEFSETMAQAGVQPIIGCTLLVENPFLEVDRSGKKGSPDRIRLYVQDDRGYRNLLKLVSRAHLESHPGEDPRTTFAELARLSEGLMALSAGHQGPVGRLLLAGKPDQARQAFVELNRMFPGRFYAEVMRHGLDDERRTEEAMLDMAFEYDVPIVATNDVHFLDASMHQAHDALLCIADGTYVVAEDRRRLTPEHRFKTAEEMRKLFSDLPEAIENTLLVARRSHFLVPIIEPILPNFAVAEGKTEKGVLRDIAEQGLERRLRRLALDESGDKASQEVRAAPYRARLQHELEIITQMGFAGYFLIVADFIHWAKSHDVPVGPGRGSGAGSLVAWSLRITDLDPLRFGLLFERFLNPERISMPDFDIDFCQEKRDQVIRYVQDKYGHDHVAQIITFGKLQARAVLRDVGRVMQQPFPVTDRICKMVPNNPANPVSLGVAIQMEPRLQYERDHDEQTAAVIAIALKLEGLYRHASTHAAGVVIGERPLEELVPLYRDPRSDMPVTQFDMRCIEKVGLVKFDFLGLKTLTVLSKAVDLVALRGIEIDLEHLALDDKATYELLSRGDTAGVFQLESSGMRNVLQSMRPDSFEDIIALVALYRPGPMDNIPTYINRKHGVEKTEYLHEWLEEILKETYGVIIYQEQVMQIAQILAGYSLGQADILRRAMGKKKQTEMDAQRRHFVDGAVEKGVLKERAEFIFDLVAKFAGYGFNKSHAAAYALVAYQTAYLKANFPVEFIAASMSLDRQNTDKLDSFKKDLQHLDIPLFPPDINQSGVAFTVEPHGAPHEARDPRAGLAVRYALSAIKNVGEKAMHSIVAERNENGPFRDPLDFARRMNVRQVNKRQLENLVMAGAFDRLNPNRAQLFEAVEMLLKEAHAAADDRESSQSSLFGQTGEAAIQPSLPDVTAWTQSQLLRRERQAIGFYLSSHPLEIHQPTLKRHAVRRSTEVLADDTFVGQEIKMAGAPDGLKERRSRKGTPYGHLSLSDQAGGFEVLVFSDHLDAARSAVGDGAPVILTVSVDKRGDDERIGLLLRGLESLEQVAERTPVNLEIHIRDAAALPALSNILRESRGGRGQVSLAMLTHGGVREVRLELPEPHKVTPELRAAIMACPGVADAREV
ncbi:MAG: DNA polymerase III subunit alpha [Proteobacteria bacterium]|nr:DNA polymerase III subunit alpha [Pseudomonadota bacterium]